MHWIGLSFENAISREHLFECHLLDVAYFTTTIVLLLSIRTCTMLQLLSAMAAVGLVVADPCPTTTTTVASKSLPGGQRTDIRKTMNLCYSSSA